LLLVAAAIIFAPPRMLNETLVYKLGLVAIFSIAAAGLHVLVNWAGELSLAQAGLIGVPAFVLGKLSADHGINPILLLPLSLIVGALIGALIGLPALRVRGLYVAIVTLAAGVAIDSFFFTRTWLVGNGVVAVPTPVLGPWTFSSSRRLYPFVALVAVIIFAALAALFRSKLARALWWTKSDPNAAAAAGVNVGAYRVGAYAMAGALAGLAGGLTAVWIQQVSPTGFPLTLSFTYLLIVMLAGPGAVTAVVIVVFFFLGLPLFSSFIATLVNYIGPIGLVITLVVYPDGANGQLRDSKMRIGRALTRLRSGRGGT
jgi:branched-chain amino acid transport system permease protein